MLLLHRSVLHTHLKVRPSRILWALQVVSGQRFSTLSQAATETPTSTPGEHDHTFIFYLIRISQVVFPHQECQPWAYRWSPRSSQRSIECSCTAAPTRSRCQQLWTCSFLKSHGRRSVSAAGKTDWRCSWGSILHGKRKRVNSYDPQDFTAKEGPKYPIQGWM